MLDSDLQQRSLMSISYYDQIMQRRLRELSERSFANLWTPRAVKLVAKAPGRWELRWRWDWGEHVVKMRQSLERPLDPKALASLLQKIAQPEWGKRLAAGEQLEDLLMEESL